MNVGVCAMNGHRKQVPAASWQQPDDPRLLACRRVAAASVLPALVLHPQLEFIIKWH